MPYSNKIDLSLHSPAHRLLLLIRDEVHRYSNQVQRDWRRHAIFSGQAPLIVPVRLDDPEGAAEDLAPIP